MNHVVSNMLLVTSCLFTSVTFAKTGGDEQRARQILQTQPVAVFSDTCVVRKGAVGDIEYLHDISSSAGSELYKMLTNDLQQKGRENVVVRAPFHCTFLTKSELSRVANGVNLPVVASTANTTETGIDYDSIGNASGKVFQNAFSRVHKSLVLYRGFGRIDLGIQAHQAEALKQQLGTPYVMLVQLYGNQPTGGKRVGSIALSLITQGGADVAVTGEYYVMSLIDLDQNKIIWIKGENVDLDFTGKKRFDIQKVFSPLF